MSRFIQVGLCVLLVGSLARAEESHPLWPAPETSTLGISIFSGYSFGEQVEGTLVGARAEFFFQYFVGALTGDVVFVPDGAAFSMILDLNGRYGPLYVGFLAGLHWLPGKGGATSPGIGAQAGLTVPLGIEGLWLDIRYRPNLIFLRTSQLLYHAVNVGLILETGL